MMVRLFVCGLLLSFFFGCRQVDLETAIEAYESGEYTEAYLQFSALAQENEPEAVRYLGCMYRDGKGVPQSTELARKYFARGVRQGDEWSMFYYSSMVLQNEKLTKTQKDFCYFLMVLAANRDVPPAQCCLGLMYKEDWPAEQNHYLARYWIGRAARNNCSYAYTEYAWYLFCGLGGGEDREKAIMWYRKGISEGDSEAAVQLGYFRLLIPSFFDAKEAFYYAKIASATGRPEGMFLQGVLLYYGIGTDSQKEAGKNLIAAAARGKLNATVFLHVIINSSPWPLEKMNSCVRRTLHWIQESAKK